MAMCTVSIVISILVLYLHHHVGYKEVPRIARIVFFHFFATILFMRTSVPKRNTKSSQQKTKVSISTKESNVNASSMEIGSFKDKVLQLGIITETSMLQKISSNLEFIKNSIEDQQREGVTQEEWKALARVVDRLFFWVCFTITVITSTIMVGRRDTMPVGVIH